VSKFCCPICSKLLDFLNETNDNLQFVVRAQHSNIYPVRLPPWLPGGVKEKLIQHFGKRLFEKLRQLPDADETSAFVYGHNKSLSLESAGESVSSAGSIDVDGVMADHRSL
jgi:hypothetical protein